MQSAKKEFYNKKAVIVSVTTLVILVTWIIAIYFENSLLQYISNAMVIVLGPILLTYLIMK